MIRVCVEHGADISSCSACFDLFSSSAMLVADQNQLKNSLSLLIKSKEHLLQQKNEVMSTLSMIKEKLYLKNPMLPKKHIRDEHLLEYIKSLTLPMNLLTMVHDTEFALAFLFQKKLIDLDFKCPCGGKSNLERRNKHFFFACPCGKSEHYTKNSMWEGSALPPSKLVLIIFLWVMNITYTNISQLVSVKSNFTNEVTSKIREVISKNYSATLPKFRGVVEIDESCFKTGRDSNNCFIKDRWVFGLYERERKLVYMQVVQCRNAKTLIPIIQERCELGCTIISDQWSAYNKLAELGFPHYTVDHSRFFVNPHSREIHTQDIEISWCWAKYHVKKHPNAALQELLHIFCWMRQFKQQSKNAELAVTLNATAEILSKYQEKQG